MTQKQPSNGAEPVELTLQETFAALAEILEIPGVTSAQLTPGKGALEGVPVTLARKGNSLKVTIGGKGPTQK